MKPGVPPKFLKQDEILGRLRQFRKAFRPERGELRQCNVIAGSAGSHAFVNRAAPGHFIAAFGERLLIAKTARERAKDIEIAFSLTYWRDGAVHGKYERIARGAADIVTLKRCGCRQHDIGVACGRCPPAFMDDDRFRLLPASTQPIEILMMMKGIAAGPVDKLDVRIYAGSAIEFVSSAGIQQHVSDPGNRYGAFCRIGRYGYFRAGSIGSRNANTVERTMTECKSAARQANAAQHRGERDRRPIWLFAAMRPLQRPCTGDDIAHFRRAPRQ